MLILAESRESGNTAPSGDSNQAACAQLPNVASLSTSNVAVNSCESAKAANRSASRPFRPKDAMRFAQFACGFRS